MFFEDAAGNGQSQSGPGRFGSGKRGEQPVGHFLRDAGAGVAHGEPDGARRLSRQFHVDAPALRHGVQRIQQKVDEDRANLPPVHETDGRLLKPVQVYLDSLLLRPAANEVASLSCQIAQVATTPLRGRQTSEIKKPLHRLFQAGDFTVDDAQILRVERRGVARP